MSSFSFQAIQCLDLSSADMPCIDVKDGKLILTAERNQERIMITAPLNGIMPKIAQTTVRVPGRATLLAKQTKNLRSAKPTRGQGTQKLTEEKVKEIRALFEDAQFRAKYSSNMGFYKDVAKMYGVHHYTIKNVIDRVSWQHI